MPSTTVSPRLFLVDDDLLSREVLALLSAEAGFSVSSFVSGESVLAHLASSPADLPFAILVDMQMPDISGDRLAQALRSICTPQTLLVAMSGTAVPATSIEAFDTFLLKPISIEDLRNVIAGSVPETPQISQPAPALPPPLSLSTYESLAESMPHDQLMELYTMCLDDAERRIGIMRQACAAGESDVFHRGAHSIKGGCGMVGALELAAIATEMEVNGLPLDGDTAPFEQFMAASTHLRRILKAQQK